MASRSPWAHHFSDFGEHTYFDAANQGPLPLAAARAARGAIEDKELPHRINNGDYFALPGRVRALAARLLGTEPEQVALTTGAGAGINVCARGLALRPGDEVLVPAMEFPSNHYPWQRLAETGVNFTQVEPDCASGAVSSERLAERISARTRVVAFAAVSYLHGGRIDPNIIVAAARRHDTYVVVDGSQAAGMAPMTFDGSGIDLYVSSGYKNLLGPYGTGIAAFSPRLLARLPLADLNWWWLEGSHDFNQLDGAPLRLRPGAGRYDAHEPAAFIHNAALAESLALLIEVGTDRAAAHARMLITRLLDHLPNGVEPASPMAAAQRSHMLCLRGESEAATRALHEQLLHARVHVSLRGNRLRVSPHIYNDEGDIDRLVAALAWAQAA
jgi:selenocysteine lyase/cysteine desulfurase